jgi:hypothetical protein
VNVAAGSLDLREFWLLDQASWPASSYSRQPAPNT